MGKRSFRRIVTAAHEDGQSYVLRDSQVPVTSFRAVNWFTQRTADALRDPPAREISRLPLGPPKGATTFQFIIVPPESPETSWEDLDAYYAVAFSGTDTVRVGTRRHPGMHRTETIDYITVLQGELTLVLSHEEIILRPFDSVVQRGTAHAWANRGSVSALFTAVTIDLSVAGVAQPDAAGTIEFAALYGLTRSELDVALALARGASLKDIAETRQVSINTVRTHAARLRDKLGVHRQADIVRTTLLHLGAIMENPAAHHPNG